MSSAKGQAFDPGQRRRGGAERGADREMKWGPRFADGNGQGIRAKVHKQSSLYISYVPMPQIGTCP